MSEKTPTIVELQALLGQLCEGELGAEGYRRIEALVRRNAEARQLYIDTVLLHGELHWMNSKASAPVEVVPGEAGGTGIAARHGSILHTLSRPLPLFGAAVAAGLLLAVGVLLPRAGVEHAAAPRVETLIVAELQQSEGCQWAGDAGVIDGDLTEGASLVAGQRLELVAGVARLLFTSGTTVLIESPAKLEMISPTSLRLDQGTLAVRVSGPVKDFVVISPDASIIDKGTSFVVHYDAETATEVEVLEGSVEVHSENDPTHSRVLEMGTSVSIGQQGNEITLVGRRWSDYRFAALIERLWEDLRVAAPEDSDLADRSSVEARFADEPEAGQVDTFYGAAPGRGWLTPWVASGNPSSEILRGDPAFGSNDSDSNHPGSDNPLLRVRFTQAFDRTIAREYGPRQGFDPGEPHLITWRWRLDGTPEDFGGSFHDRVAFYGNSYFRRNTWPTNSWLIGVAGAHDASRRGGVSNKWLREKYGPLAEDDPSVNHPRQVHPMRWYFFDRASDGPGGAVFDHRNMVDTEMAIKFDVVYDFAVAVYPREGLYDAAIRDDERTVVHTGLRFRTEAIEPANVLHFAVSTNKADDDVGFSLSSVRIEPLQEGLWQDLNTKRQSGNSSRQDTQPLEPIPND